MTEKSDYEARIERLLAKAPGLRTFVTDLRGFARDRQGRKVILGLTAEETEEFVRLDPIAKADMLGDLPRSDETKRLINRYYALRAKFDAALSKDALEELDFLLGDKKSRDDGK